MVTVSQQVYMYGGEPQCAAPQLGLDSHTLVGLQTSWNRRHYGTTRWPTAAVIGFPGSAAAAAVAASAATAAAAA